MHASKQGIAQTPNRWLTTSDCLGCHTGTNSASGATPYVLTTGVSDLTGALAGGNFYFSSLTPANGHNPVGIGPPAVVTPPGWKVGFAANDQVGGGAASATWTSSQLNCDGTWGCHGGHYDNDMHGAHHHPPPSNPGQFINPTDTGSSYRFLYRIKGYEDSHWEFAKTATTHNVYYGAARTADLPQDVQTISYFCAECHGIFHSGAGNIEGVARDSGFASPWIRHPVDVTMPLDGASPSGSVDYDSTTATYNGNAPLASTSVPTASGSDVSASSNRIVMCLSCHEAHATPYYASLRWDYRGTAGSWSNGCGYCHTSKQ